MVAPKRAKHVRESRGLFKGKLVAADLSDTIKGEKLAYHQHEITVEAGEKSGSITHTGDVGDRIGGIKFKGITRDATAKFILDASFSEVSGVITVVLNDEATADVIVLVDVLEAKSIGPFD